MRCQLSARTNWSSGCWTKSCCQGFEVEFIVDDRPLARRLHDNGVNVVVGDPRRTDTFLEADLSPSTCVIIEDNGRRSPARSFLKGAGCRRHVSFICSASGQRPPRNEQKSSTPTSRDVLPVDGGVVRQTR